MKNLIIGALLIASVLSCKDDDVKLTETKIGGFAQKGPLISGSVVTIQELSNDDLAPTGNSFIVNVSNDQGQFTVDSEMGTDYIELFATGYYFNEVSGEISDSQISLQAFVKRDEELTVNINLLTTLTVDRIKQLILEEEMDYVDAKAQAEGEILAIFGILDDDWSGFETLDIASSTESNAMLLAITATLQSTNTVGQVSELISKIRLDIKDDGTIESTLADKLTSLKTLFEMSVVRKNIAARYADLGATADIPPYEDFLDSDADGVINRDDPETYYWTSTNVERSSAGYSVSYVPFNNKVWSFGSAATSKDIWSTSDMSTWTFEGATADWAPLTDYRSIVFDNKIFVLGGDPGNQMEPPQTGVWSTSNGKDWILETQVLPRRQNPGAFSFAGKLWYVGGFNVTDTGGVGNADIWNSPDGENWTKVVTTAPFGPVGNGKFAIYDNKVWLVGGMNGGIISNDIWNSSDGISWTKVLDSTPFEPRYYGELLVFDDKLWLIAGRTAAGVNVKDVWVSTDGVNWDQSPGFVTLDPSLESASWIFDDKLWMQTKNISYLQKYVPIGVSPN